MEQNDILKHLEREKYRMNKQESAGQAGLSGMMVIIEALSYIIRKLDRETITVEPMAAVKETEKPKAEPEKKKRTVDYGKIVALYKVGWSQKKIAEEMGVSANTICKYMEKYKEKLEDGFIWDPEERLTIKSQV